MLNLCRDQGQYNLIFTYVDKIRKTMQEKLDQDEETIRVLQLENKNLTYKNDVLTQYQKDNEMAKTEARFANIDEAISSVNSLTNSEMQASQE